MATKTGTGAVASVQEKERVPASAPAWKLGTPKPDRTGTKPCACGPDCTAETRRKFAQGHDAKVFKFLREMRTKNGKGTAEDKARLVHLEKAGVLDKMLANLH